MTPRQPQAAHKKATKLKRSARAKATPALADSETKSIEEEAEPLGANFA